MDVNETNRNDRAGLTSRNSSSNEEMDRQRHGGNGNIDNAKSSWHQALSMDDATTTTLHGPKQPQSTSITKLSACVIVGGGLLGFILPQNQNLPSRSWQILSNVIGYTYFLAWSTSFYPQIFLNYERRCV